VYDEDRPEVHDIIRSWRRLLDRYGERMMVGEVYLFDPARVAAYYGSGADELNLAFNFRFLWCPWDAAGFRARVDEIEGLLPPGAQPTYVLSSHDAPRHRTRFDDARYGDARARLAALMLLTLRGTPFLYYGEEIGMRDAVIPEERVCDPVGKRFPGLGRDPERTPMQWSDEAGAGFSAGEPWLPLADDFGTVNVRRQRDDPRSLLSFYRRVIWYRKRSNALLRGTYRTINSPADTFVYLREHANQRLLVALNFAEEARQIALPSPNAGRIELGTDPQRTGRTAGWVVLGPGEGLVIAL
jgi:alpha-glucosidase